jgi:precorrin-6Y C5,15-methyltransferase (decarboxylating)
VIYIIGLGVGAYADLSAAAQSALQQCSVIIGSKRQQQLLQCNALNQDGIKNTIATHLENCVQLNYPRPFSQLSAVLAQYSQKNIALLASGDPLFYGIGAWISQHLDADHYCFYPNLSSIQIAFARIKQSWQQANVVSLHGRALITWRPHLRNRRWYALLTDKNSQPQHIAQELILQGFTQSKIWVCAALGTEQESIQCFGCEMLNQSTAVFHPLHVTLVYSETAASTSAQTRPYLPEFPGIEDQHFETGRPAGKGMITKKPIRLAALNMLQTQADEIAWDIGAGCGGMAVEWAYWHSHSTIYAIECHAERLQYLHKNSHKFGVIKNLKVIAGTAPQALAALPQPNKIFIGGSNGAMLALLKYGWQHLAVNGCMVVSCVTEECKFELMQFLQKFKQTQTSTQENILIESNAYIVSDAILEAVSEEITSDSAFQMEIEQMSLSVSKAEPLAGKQLMRPQLPVQLTKISKYAYEK